jgi:glycosyltransferase involved in cell wall biosynthesis
MSVTLSIITVCLNDKHGFARTAESLLGQSFQNFEWVVVDGGSVDGTEELLRTYSGRIDHLISEKDEGIYDAMNKGIRVASGEYCLFLNSGDTLYDGACIQQLQLHLAGDLIIGKMEVIDPSDTGNSGIREFESRKIGKRYLFYRTLPHQATCIKKALFDQYGLYDTSFVLAADHDFFVRVFNKKVKITFLPFCLSRYNLDGISSKMKTSKLFEEERGWIRRKHFPVVYRLWRTLIRILELSAKTVVRAR